MLSCSYVIPLVDILEDIRLQVEQVSIDFPSLQPPDSQMKGRRVVLNDDHVAGHSQLFHSYKSQFDDKDSNVLNWSTSVLDIPFLDEPLKLDD